MSAVPPHFTPSAAVPGLLAGAEPSGFGQTATSAMDLQWAALHDAAGVVAMLAGIVAEPMSAEVRSFPATMNAAGGWRRNLAEQGIADLIAVMEPGIAALLAVQTRGVDPATAARALWQEFQAARDGLLTLTPPGLT